MDGYDIVLGWPQSLATLLLLLLFEAGCRHNAGRGWARSGRHWSNNRTIAQRVSLSVEPICSIGDESTLVNSQQQLACISLSSSLNSPPSLFFIYIVFRLASGVWSQEEMHNQSIKGVSKPKAVHGRNAEEEKWHRKTNHWCGMQQRKTKKLAKKLARNKFINSTLIWWINFPLPLILTILNTVHNFQTIK